MARRPDLVDLDDALAALAGVDARKAQVIELRWVGGLSVTEIAEKVGVSAPTVMRDWRIGKMWRRHELPGIGARWQHGARAPPNLP